MVHLIDLFHFTSHPHRSQVTPEVLFDKSKTFDNSRRKSSSASSDKMIDKSWIFKQLHVENSTPTSSSITTSIPPTLSNSSLEKTCSSHSSKSTPSVSSSPTKESNVTEKIQKPTTPHLCDYGEIYKSLGKGSTAVITIVRKTGKDGERTRLYAVKKFRKHNKFEKQKDYMKRLTSEFCISSTFRHSNIIETIDLVLDEQENYCTVMELCSGGDLFNAIMSEHMTEVEISCCFKQLIEGLAYIHSCGVAHRDIKPENLLLTSQGMLKIADFGVSDVFQFAWEREPRKSAGLLGSEPYMAPEVFLQPDSYWGAKADVWSAGIVLYSMWYNGLAWTRACMKTNKEFRDYYQHHSTRSTTEFKAFPPYMKDVLYQMLDPNPETRISAKDLLQNPWLKSVHTCFNGADALHRVHKHSVNNRM